ncbi:uncharacterized protein [Dysidea avara]|uniref:uncharacterized protein isoform X2 n=1 Tax=Dysidea avara TaxID=196820 RepID=UPI00331E0241
MAGNQDVDAIKAQSKKMQQAFLTQDFDKSALLYTEDCRIVPHGGPIMNGREAAKKLGQGFSKAGVKEAEETFDKMVPLGADYYYVDGSSVAYLEGKKVFDKLNFTLIWRKVSGEWLVYSHAFCSQTPPKPPPA